MRFLNFLISIFIVVLFDCFTVKAVFAQQNYLPSLPSGSVVASPSAQATESAREATPSSIVEKIVEKKPDITEQNPLITGKLERYLVNQKLEPLGIRNFLRWSILKAVKQGVPANTIVLVLLFPLIAAIIASVRHLIGLRGFGIFTPAMISVAFVATGIVSGLLLFGSILIVATLGRVVLRRLRLQYLPRMALLLWFVSLGVLGIIFLSPIISQPNLTSVTIFPILIMILLVENFIEVQSGGNMREAIRVTTETLLIAFLCYWIMNLEPLQKFVLLNPEITVLGIAVYDLFVGKYVGLRLMEYWRFRQIIKNG
jgi:hypothetical protein